MALTAIAIIFLLSDDFWPTGQFRLSRHESKVREVTMQENKIQFYASP